MKEEKIQLIESVIEQLVNQTRGEEDRYTLTIKMSPSKVEYTIKPSRGKDVEGSITF